MVVQFTSGQKLPCLNGWKISIKSLLLLWADLSANHDFKFLLTNRLNQDCLENMFSVIRSRHRHGDNPDPHQFLAAFRHVVVDKLLPSAASNCQTDIDKVLLDLASFSQVTAPSQSRESTLHDEHLSVSADESNAVNTLNICTQNVVSYMGGYVLRTIPFSCSKCHSKFTVPNLSDNEPTTEFLKAEANRATGALIYPSICFVSLRKI